MPNTFMSEPMARVLSRMPDAKPTSNGWTARCPAHDDKTASLSLAHGDDGRALLFCHAGCDLDSIVVAIDLEKRDLFERTDRATIGSRTEKPAKKVRSFATSDEAASIYTKERGRPSNVWTYNDADGAPIGLVLRWDKGKKKDIRPVSRIDGRWYLSLPKEERPLYALDRLAANPNAPIYLVEGEKCADQLLELGLLATTSAGGASSAAKTDWRPCAGRDVTQIPDEDAPGVRYSEDVRRICEALTPPARVSTLRLKELTPKSGDDVVDWVQLHHGGDRESAKADLLQRADEAMKATGGHAETLADSVSLLSLLADPDAMKPPCVLVSGFAGFDQAQPWNAVEEGAKVLWGGEPGTGKTRCMLALALGYARHGHRVVYALGEMSPRQMMRRALLMQAGLGNAALLNPLPQHSAKLETGATTLREFAENLCFIQQPLRFDSIARAAAWADVVFVDPLQSVRAAATYEARHEELDALMHHIVQVSAQERTVFHMASEIGKPEGNAERTLQTAFKGSSALVQYADAAYLLKQASGGVQEVVCLKQREGERHPFTFHIGTGGLQLTAPAREGGAR